MSTTKTVTELAIGFAAGIYTEDALLELTGDDNIVGEILAIAGGAAVASVATTLAQSILDTEPVTDALDVVDDVVSAINPFNW